MVFCNYSDRGQGSSQVILFANGPASPPHPGQPNSPGGSDGKESACKAGDLGLIPGLGKSPGEESGNPLQYSCLENSMDRGGLQRVGHD